MTAVVRGPTAVVRATSSVARMPPAAIGIATADHGAGLLQGALQQLLWPVHLGAAGTVGSSFFFSQGLKAFRK